MRNKTEITPAMIVAGIRAWNKEIESGVLRAGLIDTWKRDAMGVTVREIFCAMLDAQKKEQFKAVA